MQERMEPYRKSPKRLAIERRINLVNHSRSEEPITAGTAEILWLMQLPDDVTQADLDMYMRDGTMTDAVETLRDSREFERFAGGMDLLEMAQLIERTDPAVPDGMKELQDEWQRAKNEVQQRDPWAESLYNDLRGNPEERAKLIGQLNALLAEDENHHTALDREIHSEEHASRLRRAVSDLRDAMVDFGQIGQQEVFMSAAERMRYTMAEVRGFFGEQSYAGISQKLPALADIEGHLALPEMGTGAEYELIFRHTATNPIGDRLQKESALFTKIALFEMLKNEPDWKTAKVDRKVLEDTTSRLFDGVYASNMSEQKLTNLLTSPGLGKEIAEDYHAFVQKTDAEKERRKHFTAEDRIEELAGFPMKKGLDYTKYWDSNQVIQLQSEILAVRNMQKIYADDPDKFKTAEDVDKVYQVLREAMPALVVQAQKSYPGRKASELINADQTGAKLEEYFVKGVRGCESSFRMTLLHSSLQPTAREQIEALQRRIKTRDRTSTNVSANESGKLRSEQRLMIAQIIAAREVLGIRPGVIGGDPNLDRKMTPAIYERAGEINKSRLRDLSDREIDQLALAAVKGHGGELMKQYNELLSRKTHSLDELPKELPRSEWPTAKQRIEIMQEKLAAAEDPALKKQYLAQIIAARQTVEARRGGILGGDERLQQKLDPEKLSVRLKDVNTYLSNIPQDAVERLCRQAGEGHGGAMMENYKRENTCQRQYEAMKRAFANPDPNAPKPEFAKALAIAYAAMQPGGADAPLDEASIRRNARSIMISPGYQMIANDKSIAALYAQGDITEIGRRMFEVGRQTQVEESRKLQQINNPLNVAEQPAEKAPWSP